MLTVFSAGRTLLSVREFDGQTRLSSLQRSLFDVVDAKSLIRHEHDGDVAFRAGAVLHRFAFRKPDKGGSAWERNVSPALPADARQSLASIRLRGRAS